MEQIGHQTVGAAASAHVEIIFGTRIVDDVPSDEKVGQKAFFMYQVDLVFDAFLDGGRDYFKAIFNAIKG